MKLSVTLTEKINGEWTFDDCTFDIRNAAFGTFGFTVMLPDGDIFHVKYDDYVMQACAW